MKLINSILKLYNTLLKNTQKYPIFECFVECERVYFIDIEEDIKEYEIPYSLIGEFSKEECLQFLRKNIKNENVNFDFELEFEYYIMKRTAIECEKCGLDKNKILHFLSNYKKYYSSYIENIPVFSFGKWGFIPEEDKTLEENRELFYQYISQEFFKIEEIYKRVYK